MVALHGVQFAKLPLDKVDRQASRIVRPGPNLDLHVRVRLSREAEKG